MILFFILLEETSYILSNLVYLGLHCINKIFMKLYLFLFLKFKLISFIIFLTLLLNHFKSFIISLRVVFLFLLFFVLMINSYLFEYVMLSLVLFWICFGSIFYFYVQIISQIACFSFIHINYFFRFYFRYTNVLISIFSSKTIKMNTNYHHQNAKSNPDFSISIGYLFLIFWIKYRFLKFKTLFSFSFQSIK